jgi:hypothetical protein
MRAAILVIALFLPGCSTLNEYGIGGPPSLLCDSKGQAVIDDRLIGPDAARVSMVRRFKDGDTLCK